MGRRRVCNELVGDLTVDKDGDTVDNFIAVINQVREELSTTYHTFKIYADPDNMGVFKIYGTRYLTDEEVAAAKAVETEKTKNREVRKAARGKK